MRNRTGIIVLLDMFILLFFVLAVRSVDNQPTFNVEEDNTFGPGSEILIARNVVAAGEKVWQVLEDGGAWRLVHDGDKWRDSVVDLPCNKVCLKLGAKDETARFVITGRMAHHIAMLYYNECRLAPDYCRGLVISIVKNSVQHSHVDAK